MMEPTVIKQFKSVLLFNFAMLITLSMSNLIDLRADPQPQNLRAYHFCTSYYMYSECKIS